jgi:hypothetical protein
VHWTIKFLLHQLMNVAKVDAPSRERLEQALGQASNGWFLVEFGEETDLRLIAGCYAAMFDPPPQDASMS